MKIKLKTIEIESIENTGMISIYFNNKFCGVVDEEQLLICAFDNLKKGKVR
jgi:hypothetical protein